MKRFAIIVVGFVLASPSHARSEKDYPHRDWGQVLALDMSVDEATACVAREMNRNGSSTVIPVDGGNDIDVKASAGFFGTVGEPWQTFKIRPAPGKRSTLTASYRHPASHKSISKDVERMGKQCLKVR